MLLKIAAGEIDILVGTQALLQEDVFFRKLALVVIDEQHKFGVRQRATLKLSGLDPHYLVMTATPIPRTVTMTLFGDLEVSTLRDSPPGRQQVRTYLVEQAQRERWWKFFGEKLREGRQGFVIAPLVEESEEIEAASLDSAYEELANGPLEAFRMGLIHGRMNAKEKESAMADFREGRTQVLVSTSVVEVGIDVPNATLMAIEAGNGSAWPSCTSFAAGSVAGAARLLRRLRRSADGGGRPAIAGLCLHDRRIRVGGGRFRASRPRGIVRHPAARSTSVADSRFETGRGSAGRDPLRRRGAGGRRRRSLSARACPAAPTRADAIRRIA